MKSYIVKGLDSNDRELLHVNGVVFYPWDTDDLIINESQLNLFLKLLEATATEQATEFEGMYLLNLQFNTSAASGASGRALDRARAQSRAKYIEVCSARLAEFINQASSRTEGRRKALKPAQEGFGRLSRQVFLTEQSDRSELEEAFAEQFERLSQVEKVKAVRVTNGALLVYTDLLKATDQLTGVEHDLGEFLIVIRTDGTDDGVRWFNRTRRVRTLYSGMNAPRIYSDGSALADEIKETLIELIAQFEFATVAELAIEFAESLSDDELSKHIDKWPVAKA